MTALAVEVPRFTFDEWSRIVETPTRDKRYLATQLGGDIADFLGWELNEEGASPQTVDTYERDLAVLAVAVRKAAREVTTDDLRAVIATFTPGSRHGATAAYRKCFRWLYEEGRIPSNPAGRIRYPKRPKPALTDLFTDEEKTAIVTAQTDIMDRVGVLLLLRAGLRKAELRHLTVKDVNMVERLVLVRRGKGGKARRVPIRGALVQALDELLMTDVPGHNRPRKPDEYLLCPLKGGGRSKTRNPRKPMGQRGAHEWWYRCLQRADIVEPKVTSGRRMHGSRHTYATDLGRATGWNMLAVQKNLGHSKIATTIDIYTQFAFEDQEAAVEALPEIGEV